MSQKETFYFSHDYNARTDPKIKKLLAKHGMVGYGIFWSIIEDLYNNDNCLPADFGSMSYDLRCTEEMVQSIVTGFDLFAISGEFFGSLSVQRRLNERAEKSKKARNSANERWKKKSQPELEFPEHGTDAKAPETDANAMQAQSDSNAIKESKGKESKENSYKKALLSEITISDFPELNPEYIEVAKAFNGLFRNNLIEAGASTIHVDKAKGACVDDIRLMIENDKYTMEALREVYQFLQKDDFWKKNILSTSKLREKMDKLKMQMKHGNSRITNKEATSWNDLAEVVANAFGQGQ